jgi:hypothetical protein
MCLYAAVCASRVRVHELCRSSVCKLTRLQLLSLLPDRDPQIQPVLGLLGHLSKLLERAGSEPAHHSGITVLYGRHLKALLATQTTKLTENKLRPSLNPISRADCSGFSTGDPTSYQYPADDENNLFAMLDSDIGMGGLFAEPFTENGDLFTSWSSL